MQRFTQGFSPAVHLAVLSETSPTNQRYLNKSKPIRSPCKTKLWDAKKSYLTHHRTSNDVPIDPFHCQCWNKVLKEKDLPPRSDTTSTVAVDVPALRGWGRGCGCTRVGCRNDECLLRLWGCVWLWARHGIDLLEGFNGCSFTVSLLLVFIPEKAKRKRT